MRSRRGLIAAVFSLVAISSMASTHHTSATALATRPPQAACSGWNRIQTLRLKGSTELGGLSGSTTTIVDTRTGRYTTLRDYGVYSAAEGFNGQQGWSRDRSGASHELDSSAARAISTTLAWLTRRGWCDPAGELPPSMSVSDDTAAGTATELVWQVTPAGGSPAILRFDRASGLPRSFEVRLPFNRLVRHFDDWRRADYGVLIAWSQRDEDPDDESLEKITVASAEVSRASAPARMFVRPPLPADSSIVDQAPSATVAYEDDGIGRIYVPVLIDGQGPFAFELDTGGHLILSDQTAAALHLSPAGTLSNTGGGSGIVHGGLVRTREIRIGSAVMRNQVAKVLPMRAASNDRGSRPPRAGILGLELFERFVVQLDRARKTVTLTPIATFAGVAHGIALPIHFNEDAPLVSGTFAGIEGEFELDSGNAGPVIVEGYWAGQHGLDQRLRQGIQWAGAGVGGEFAETLTRGDFSLGSLPLPHEIVSYVGATDRGSESTRMQAGVIGEATLRRFDMTYDYGHGRVWIDPEPKAPAQPFNRAGLRLGRDTPESFAVSSVVPGSPAAAAGLQPGDQILAVNSQPAGQLAASDVFLMCSGAVGTRIDLLVRVKEGGATQSRSLRLAELLP